METATLRPARLSGEVQAALIALLLVLAAGCWLITEGRMAGMDAGPGTDLGGLGWFAGVWLLMMAAMMLPSVAPMVLAYAGVEAGAREPVRGGVRTAAFLAGYLIAWGAAGLGAFLLFDIVRSLDLGVLEWDAGGPYVAGAAILGAALYELTPAKDACLRRCRAPREFLSRHEHPGAGGALRAGLEHGAVCIGCCWALMVVLFALGVMSLTWMAFVAVLIAAEKLLPGPAVVRVGIAVLLTVLAFAVAFAPESIPGLTIPGSIDMGSMDAQPMGMQ